MENIRFWYRSINSSSCSSRLIASASPPFFVFVPCFLTGNYLFIIITKMIGGCLQYFWKILSFVLGTDGCTGNEGGRLFHICVRTVRVHSVCPDRTLPFFLFWGILGFEVRSVQGRQSVREQPDTWYRKSLPPSFPVHPGGGSGGGMFIAHRLICKLQFQTIWFQEEIHNPHNHNSFLIPP